MNMSNQGHGGKATRPKLGLLELPLVIVRMILEQLYRDDRKSLLAFRLASRSCLPEADMLLFRSVRLSQPWDTECCPEWLLTRLGDPKDTLAAHIRFLQVGPFFGDGLNRFDEVSTQIEHIISNLNNLRILCWNTDILDSQGALRAFHTTCPAAQLHVVQQQRSWKSIDRDLISSPQLHSLDMTFHSLNNPFPGFEESSELPVIKQCLLQGNNIKVLHLKGISINISMSLGVPIEFKDLITGLEKGALNFHWQDGDQFPALREFRWDLWLQEPLYQYSFSAEESRLWLRCTDWSRLRELHLGFHVDAPPFFKVLTGETPQLRRLTFCVFLPTTDISIITAFSKSITALEFLSLRSDRYQMFMNIVSAVVDHHGQSLNEMDLGVYELKTWTRLQYEDLFEKAPMLSHLRTAAFHAPQCKDVFEGKWAASKTNLTPSQKYDMMKQITLESKDVSVRAKFGLPWRD